MYESGNFWKGLNRGWDGRQQAAPQLLGNKGRKFAKIGGEQK